MGHDPSNWIEKAAMNGLAGMNVNVKSCVLVLVLVWFVLCL